METVGSRAEAGVRAQVVSSLTSAPNKRAEHPHLQVTTRVFTETETGSQRGKSTVRARLSRQSPLEGEVTFKAY